MTNPLLHDLATEIREINAANGWGLDFDATQRDTIPGYLALIHSEIAEASGARWHRDAIQELGDVIVRALDLGELLCPGHWRHCSHEFALMSFDPRQAKWETDLLQLHQITSEALEAYRKEAEYLPPLLGSLHQLVATTWQHMKWYGAGQDPEKVIRDILDKNRQRGYRHGGRRT